MGLFRLLFMEKKCLVHSAFGNEPYFKAANQLSEHGISYDVVRKSNYSVFGGGQEGAMPFARTTSEISNTQYDFYVKKEDEHRAEQALRH
ncbi:hypothetical protein [Planococcus shenhongbingii]|uniref:DUF2007 domain-containing protein n=1 Tax=Planococcus shenhongbingii TaxID=3058398 RepID=A0ABT8NFI4_9BACL|nr:hypothetical protein [Planococcus sp. N017]MDN7246245.1 hypothetical protein [Planococcus sp. N017]